jgi:SAM-dependent methyltransferase
MSAAPARAYALRALARVGLLHPLYRLRQRWAAWQESKEAPREADGLPIPPPLLRMTTCDNPDPDAFVEGGRNVARILSARAAEHGREPGSLSAMLDFGCGCGRVARHWAGLRGPEVHGCDYNEELVSWCREQLPFLHCARNELEPPLPYEDGKFDLVYSISVFTHLSIQLQADWIRELRRVLAPGGLLLVTMHGDSYAERFLLPRELRRYRAGEPVVLFGELSGDRCAAFHPHDYVAGRLLEGFRLLSYAPDDEVPAIGQDLYVAEVRGNS